MTTKGTQWILPCNSAVFTDLGRLRRKNKRVKRSRSLVDKERKAAKLKCMERNNIRWGRLKRQQSHHPCSDSLNRSCDRQRINKIRNKSSSSSRSNSSKSRLIKKDQAQDRQDLSGMASLWMSHIIANNISQGNGLRMTIMIQTTMVTMVHTTIKTRGLSGDTSIHVSIVEGMSLSMISLTSTSAHTPAHITIATGNCSRLRRLTVPKTRSI